MTPGEFRKVTRFARWHLCYLLVIALFFSLLFFTGTYKTIEIFRERFIFLVLSPLSTLVFVLASPWRGAWKEAVLAMYERLEGEEVFCVMGGMVFLFGFFIYSVFLWGLGALIPSLFYM
jgi:hypothetical protein